MVSVIFWCLPNDFVDITQKQFGLDLGHPVDARYVFALPPAFIGVDMAGIWGLIIWWSLGIWNL